MTYKNVLMGAITGVMLNIPNVSAQNNKVSSLDSEQTTRECSDSQYIFNKKQTSIRKHLEKQLSLISPTLVHGYINTQYCPGEQQNGNIQVSVFDKEAVKKRRKNGFIHINAGYNSLQNTFTFHESIAGKDSENTDIHTIHHEVWHSIYDEVIHDPAYKGPTKEDIDTYSYNLSKTKEYEPLRKKLQKIDMVRDVQYNMKKIGKYLRSSLLNIKSKWLTFDTKIKNKTEKYKNFSEFHLEQLFEDMKDFYKNDISFFVDNHIVLQGKFPEMKLIIQESDDEDIDNTLSKLDLKNKELEKMFSSFKKQHNALKKNMDNIDTRIDTHFKDIRIDHLQKKIDALEAEFTTTSDKIKQKNLLVKIKVFKKSLKLLSRPHPSSFFNMSQLLSFHNNSFHNIQDTFVHNTNSKLIRQILEDPNEFMARKIQALYSLHFSKVLYNLFPLSKEDLTFLSQFSLHDQPLFQQALEKYKIGLEMIENGSDEKQVRNTLLYATEFTWKNTKYSWPKTPVSFTGNFPVYGE
jgi:hypothetical protein